MLDFTDTEIHMEFKGVTSTNFTHYHGPQAPLNAIVRPICLAVHVLMPNSPATVLFVRQQHATSQSRLAMPGSQHHFDARS